MSEPRVHAVLVTYRRPHDLASSVARLASQTRPVDSLTIVNNDATASVELNSEEGRPFKTTTIDAGDNLGPAGGIALGMDAVLADADDADLVLVLDDDDPLVDDHVVADLFDVLNSHPDKDSVGGVGLRGAVMNRRSGRLSRPIDIDGGKRVDYLKSNWAPLYRVTVLRKEGVFRSDLFFGFDDLEFGLRLTNAGYRLEAHELGRPDEDPRPTPRLGFRRSPWRTYYTTRNLLAIYSAHVGRTTSVLNGLLLCVLKPSMNLLRGPREAWPQVRFTWLAGIDVLRGRMGRTVEPDVSKVIDS